MSRTIRNEPRAMRAGRNRNPIPRRRIQHAPTRADVRALQFILTRTIVRFHVEHSPPCL